MNGKPPTGVTILAICFVVLGFLTLLLPLIQFFSVFWIIAGIGLLFGSNSCRLLAIDMTILAVLFSCFFLYFQAYIFAPGPFIGVLTVYYLTRPWVKAFFAQAWPAPTTNPQSQNPP